MQTVYFTTRNNNRPDCYYDPGGRFFRYCFNNSTISVGGWFVANNNVKYTIDAVGTDT